MNDQVTEVIWTLDGDETSWSSWAESMAQAPATQLMQKLIAGYHTEQRNWAIDVGCGTGRAFLPLEDAGYRVIGFDPCLNCIKLSQQRVSQTELRAYPVLASIVHCPLPDSSVAFIFAISSLFHLNTTELKSALHEISRVLLPGGKAVLHFLDLEDWRRSIARQIHAEQAPSPGYQAVVTCFCSPSKIRQWITQTGLRIERLELQTYDTEAGQQRNWLAYCTK